MDSKCEVKVYDGEYSYDSAGCLHSGAYLFINNKSESYASSSEHRTVYRCVCMDCGRRYDYDIFKHDKKRIIYSKNGCIKFYDIRKRYIELKNSGLNIEEIVSEINRELELEEKDNILILTLGNPLNK